MGHSLSHKEQEILQTLDHFFQAPRVRPYIDATASRVKEKLASEPDATVPFAIERVRTGSGSDLVAPPLRCRSGF